MKARLALLQTFSVLSEHGLKGSWSAGSDVTADFSCAKNQVPSEEEGEVVE